MKLHVKHGPEAVITNDGGFDTPPTQWTFEADEIEIETEGLVKQCRDDENPNPNVQVWPARDSDGFCNACSPDADGFMPRRKTIAVRLGTKSGGGLVFRLCSLHADDLITQAKRLLR